MRTLRLARVAADAEILLLRRRLLTAQRRAVFAGVAALFGVAVLVVLHALGYVALVQYAHVAPFFAVLIVGAVDLVLALLFALLASGAMPDPVAEEATLLRDQSLAQMKAGLTATALLVPAGRLLGRKHIYALALAGLTARFLGGR
jgi:hypothetical protein